MERGRELGRARMSAPSPRLRGVEIRISCDRLSQPFRSRMPWCALAKDPWGSVLKNTRAHALIKFSWNILW